MTPLALYLQAVENRKEFAIKRYDGLVSIDYKVALRDSFEGLRRDCRGITFCESTGEIISRPYHKFFNLYETQETHPDNLAGTVAYFTKADGSMIHVFPWKDKLRAATCGGYETNQAQTAQLILDKDKTLQTCCWQLVEDGFTPLFELVGPSNQIVVRYDKMELIYLGARHISNGAYKNWNNDEYPLYQGMAQLSWLIEHIKELKGVEGFVGISGSKDSYDCDNLIFFKLKTPWYIERHRVFGIQKLSKHRLYELVFDGTLADMVGLANDDDKPFIENTIEEVNLALLDESERLEKIFMVLREKIDPTDRAGRKEFAQLVMSQYKDDSTALFSLLSDNLLQVAQQSLLRKLI